MISTTRSSRGRVMAAVLALSSACGACATLSGLDGLNEVDGIDDASVDQATGSAADGGSANPNDAGLASPDSGAAKADAGSTDAGKDSGPVAPIPSILCGQGKCSDAGQLCCYNRLLPKSSTCEEIEGGAACTPLLNKDPLYCDDKADCPTSKPFCCFDGKTGAATCDTEANCNANAGRYLCSTLADCPDASTNCSAGPGVFNLIVCK